MSPIRITIHAPPRAGASLVQAHIVQALMRIGLFVSVKTGDEIPRQAIADRLVHPERYVAAMNAAGTTVEVEVHQDARVATDQVAEASSGPTDRRTGE